LTSSAKAGYVPSLDLALVHLGLGEIEQSRKYLSAANEERSPWLPFFKVDPRTRLLWSTSDQAGQT
jgi:hypothetical protein